MNKFEFKAGDRVKCVFFGDEIFTLTERITSLTAFPVSFERVGHVLTFLRDGRHSTHHTHPSITLVERPKTKRTIHRYVNVYASKISETHETRDDADKYANIIARVACVELTGEYET